MITETISFPRGQRGLWLGLIITEIVVGLTAVIIPVTYTLSAMIVIPLLGIFYAKPIFVLLCVIPFRPNVLVRLL